jgi:hypothetical protein
VTDLQTAPTTNGHRTRAEAPIVPVRRQSRVRVPEVAIGLIVMLGFGLAAVLWQMHATAKEPVLALAQEIRRGEVIERDDLRVVYLATDEAIAVVGRDDAVAVIGHVASSDMAAGTLLTRASVLDGSAVEAGAGVVGLALEPGQLPSSRLRAGDVVNVVRGAGPGDAGSAPAGEVVVRGAEVFAVEPASASGRVFVSLKASEGDADLIAAAAEQGPVRLVWVGR